MSLLLVAPQMPKNVCVTIPVNSLSSFIAVGVCRVMVYQLNTLSERWCILHPWDTGPQEWRPSPQSWGPLCQGQCVQLSWFTHKFFLDILDIGTPAMGRWFDCRGWGCQKTVCSLAAPVILKSVCTLGPGQPSAACGDGEEGGGATGDLWSLQSHCWGL